MMTRRIDACHAFWENWDKADSLKKLLLVKRLSKNLLNYSKLIASCKSKKDLFLFRQGFDTVLNSYFEDLYNYACRKYER
jgi:hypothetical protein